MLREEKLNIHSEYNRKLITTFLTEHQLLLEDVDTCYCVFHEEKIVATACKSKNVLKCFAIDNEYRSAGIFDNILSKLLSDCYREKEKNIFVFTKRENVQFFIAQKFSELAHGNNSALLYKGEISIENFLKQKYTSAIDNTKNKKVGAVVINANPFTLGHYYLIKCASEQVDELLVFVVEEDKSFFSFEERFFLVKENTKDLRNILVLPSSKFLISAATFPSYFLKETKLISSEHAIIDAHVFGKFFVPTFNISIRFLGEEPLDENTKTYNTILSKTLPNYSCEVKIFSRLKTENDKIISASNVRKAIQENNFEAIRELVSQKTYEYICARKLKQSN